MADIFSKKKRSEIMSRIRSKNTTPELLVRKFLFSKGFRYRLHSKQLRGKPDIVLKKYRTVILVNGCFWHGHESDFCTGARTPRSNADFWRRKIERNRSRDRETAKVLQETGWHVLVVWECELRNKETRTLTFGRLVSDLRNNHPG